MSWTRHTGIIIWLTQPLYLLIFAGLSGETEAPAPAKETVAPAAAPSKASSDVPAATTAAAAGPSKPKGKGAQAEPGPAAAPEAVQQQQAVVVVAAPPAAVAPVPHSMEALLVPLPLDVVPDARAFTMLQVCVRARACAGAHARQFFGGRREHDPHKACGAGRGAGLTPSTMAACSSRSYRPIIAASDADAEPMGATAASPLPRLPLAGPVQPAAGALPAAQGSEDLGA